MIIKPVKAVIMAGGMGNRLKPLTDVRPKPTVPIEKRRLIDFVVSNCLASDLVESIEVLGQAHPNHLIRHVQDTYIAHRVRKPVGLQVADMTTGEEYFKGNADAVRQLKSLFYGGHDNMLVLCADHIYVTAYDSLIEFHHQKQAAVTVMVKQVSASQAASRFGVFEIDKEGKIVDVVEKSTKPPTLAGTDQCLASMGIYVFNLGILQKLLEECKGDDFGSDIIPYVFRHHYPIALFKYDGLWFDVGTIVSLWQANMELVSPNPAINLYDKKHPIIHKPRHLPSPKFVNGCEIEDSIISDGCIVAGRIDSSVLSTRVKIGLGSQISQCVIFDNVQIGENVRLTRVIVDKHSFIEDEVVLGEDLDQEMKNYPDIEFVRDERISGIPVVPRGAIIKRIS